MTNLQQQQGDVQLLPLLPEIIALVAKGDIIEQLREVRAVGDRDKLPQVLYYSSSADRYMSVEEIWLRKPPVEGDDTSHREQICYAVSVVNVLRRLQRYVNEKWEREVSSVTRRLLWLSTMAMNKLENELMDMLERWYDRWRASGVLENLKIWEHNRNTYLVRCDQQGQRMTRDEVRDWKATLPTLRLFCDGCKIFTISNKPSKEADERLRVQMSVQQMMAQIKAASSES